MSKAIFIGTSGDFDEVFDLEELKPTVPPADLRKLVGKRVRFEWRTSVEKQFNREPPRSFEVMDYDDKGTGGTLKVKYTDGTGSLRSGELPGIFIKGFVVTVPPLL